jgi:6-pyruvoyltetrahydropterin/6-carboxytetrahydropterin synthase
MIERRGAAMYRINSITISHHFVIAHGLGLCCVFGLAPQLHCTTFVVEAELRRDALDADGIIRDTGRSFDLLKTVLAEFDYRSLDEFAECRGRNTTREFLDCEVHKRLVGRIEEGAPESQASTSLRVSPRENQVAWSAYDAPLG